VEVTPPFESTIQAKGGANISRANIFLNILFNLNYFLNLLQMTTIRDYKYILLFFNI